ncbi:MAG: hypothetical protein AAF614_42110 [Chloroflexota bacterium]
MNHLRSTTFTHLGFYSLTAVLILIAIFVAFGMPSKSTAKLAALPLTPSQAPNFIAFESGPVRPLALTPNGSRLIVTNIPDNSIEIFTINDQGGLEFEKSIPVGLEPVAVAARTNNEVWVVNHLSDSVSIVDLAKSQVIRTLLVGDEPRDIVFGGENNGRSFITTAHRGQQRTALSLAGVPGAGDPQLTTPSVGRADIWVFDANNLGNALGGVPEKIVVLFGDTPRALAVTPDGSTVYAAIFNSGNQTTVTPMPLVCSGNNPYSPCDGDGITSPNGLPNGQIPGGPLPPWDNHAGAQAPLTGMVVKYNNASGTWEDEEGRNWGNAIRFTLPDLDVFAIDANTLQETTAFAHVGTNLFNMVVNPSSGKLYVTNTNASNEVRFEGSANHADSTVQGKLAQARITVIDPTAKTVESRHLNKHINYAVSPAPAGTKAHSLATPLEAVVSADGNTLFVAAFGSSKVGVLPTAALENNSFDPTTASANYISVSGGGPSGLVLNDTHNRLYVYTRFDNGISTLDPATGSEVSHTLLHNPEPNSVVAGRPFLYDATTTSSNGEASCASCHIFGDNDHIAWDLGDPDGDVTYNALPIHLEHEANAQAQAYNLNGTGNVRDFHPMKGPMLTQSLRGMAHSGAMHWRGDRSTGFFGDDPMDERLSFKNFIVAFNGLHGDTTPTSDAQRQADMDIFADFALALTYPPNPVRNLDNSLTASQANGANLFDGPRRLDGAPPWYDEQTGNQEGATCEECHRLAPEDGFFGTGGAATFEGLTQIFKTAHLRNLYTRIGMFGMANTWLTIDDIPGNTHEHMGDQIRGYGFTHDGIYDTVYRFQTSQVFNEPGFTLSGYATDQDRRDMEQYLLAFDSDLAPIVGQQVTLTAVNVTTISSRLDLFIARATAPFTSKILGGTVTECDLVVHSFADGRQKGWLYDTSSAAFLPDQTGQPTQTNAQLRQWITSNNLDATYTCAPPGSGQRIALDRDQDGALNGDEHAAQTDPANPGSVLGACNDGIDNDGDGMIDSGDNGCVDAQSNIENPQCSDGHDNDGDGHADSDDPACIWQPWGNDESEGDGQPVFRFKIYVPIVG